MNELVVDGRVVLGPVECRHYVDNPEVHRFSRRRLRASSQVTEVVVHESTTQSVIGAVNVLEAKTPPLGVHLIIGPGGELTQHADLGADRVGHAGAAHNGQSVGIEVINPYYPRHARRAPWRDSPVISAAWAHEGRYVLPSVEQIATLAEVLRWLTSPASGLPIPRTWPGVDARGRMALSRVAGTEKATPGLHAHAYWEHADGAFPLACAYAVIELGMTPARARTAIQVLAAGKTRRIRLADITTAA